MKMKLVLLTAVLALAASAAPISNCSGITDVTGLAGICGVAGSPLVFGGFSVSTSAGFTRATIGMAARYSNDETYLDFQIGGIRGPGSPDMGDIILQYGVLGPIDGVDLALQASPMLKGSNITITELVCSERFVNSACRGVTLANLVAVSFGNAVAVSASFSQQMGVWIKKDIQFNGATTSDFTNSHASAPEPGAVVLTGAGLLWLVRKRYPRKG